jgi:hypothetical protein
MNTNLPVNTDPTYETTTPSTASCEVAEILELLGTAGLAAEAVFDGQAERCPHCLSPVLSEAA